MPYLKIQFNRQLEETESKALLTSASQKIANALRKPERYVMVELTANPSMLFGGTDEPAAYLELKSIGLPDSQIKTLSHALSSMLETAVGIPPSRIYIEFTDVKASYWGWNGSTF